MKKIKSLVTTVAGFMENMNRKHVSAYSAQAAYFIILSFIPFMLLIMTSVRYTPLNREEVVGAVMQICPDGFRTFIEGIVNEVYEKSLSVVPVTALLAMWSAGKGVQSLTNGFNCIYQVKETRNYLVTRLRSVFYTLIFVIAIVLTLILQVFGNSLQRELSRHLPFLDRLVSMIIGMRVAITLVSLCLVFLLLYKFVPNRKATFRSQVPGAMFSAVCWSGFSFGFSLYFDYYSGAANMYGSMTTIILILLWMYFCMNIMMIGAQINNYFEEKFRWVHQVATEAIRKEYEQLVGHDEEEDEKGKDEEIGEKIIIPDKHA